MPIYDIEDDQGRKLSIEGDSEPSEQEIEQLFASEFSGSRELTKAELPPSMQTTPQYGGGGYRSLMGMSAGASPEKVEAATTDLGSDTTREWQRDRRQASLTPTGDYGITMPKLDMGEEPRQEIAPQGTFGRLVEETAQAPVRLSMMKKDEQGNWVNDMGAIDVQTGDEINPREHTALAVPLPTDLLNNVLPNGTIKDVAMGARNATAGLLNFFASPQGVAMAGKLGPEYFEGIKGGEGVANALKIANAGGDIRPLIQSLSGPSGRAIAGAFAVDMAKHAPEALSAGDKAMASGDVSGAVEHWLGGASQLALAGLSATHALGPSRGGVNDASQIQEAAEVHGDVQSQPGETQQRGNEVPVQEGGAGVQTKAEGGLLGELSQDEHADYQQLKGKFFEGQDMTQTDLDKLDEYDARARSQMMNRVESQPPPQGMISEAQTLIRNAVNEQGAQGKVYILDPNKIMPGSVMSGRVAQFDPRTGRIEINGRALAEDLSRMAPEKREQYVRSVISEEVIHSKTEPRDAKLFHDNSSGIERAIGKRIYLGKGVDKSGVGELTPEYLGYEMIRRRMQRMQRMTPTEIAAAVGREKWTLKSLDALDNVIFKTRQLLGTDASNEQTAALFRLQKASQIARAAITASPASLRRENDELTKLATKMSDPSSKVDNADSVKVGMDLNDVSDLDALLDMKRSVKSEMAAMKADAHAKIEAGDQKGAMQVMNQMAVIGTKNQIIREAIETATNTGSWSEERQTAQDKPLGKRPLDWSENPKVEQWLRDNGAEVGIELSEGESVGPGAPRRDSLSRILEKDHEYSKTSDMVRDYIGRVEEFPTNGSALEALKNIDSHISDLMDDVQFLLVGGAIKEGTKSEHRAIKLIDDLSVLRDKAYQSYNDKGQQSFPAAPRRAQRSKHELEIDLSNPPKDDAKWTGWMRDNFDKARRIPDQSGAEDIGRQLLAELDDRLEIHRQQAREKYGEMSEEEIAQVGSLEAHGLTRDQVRSDTADYIDSLDEGSRDMLDKEFVDTAYLERDIDQWIKSRQPKPDTGEDYQMDLGIGAPRRGITKSEERRIEEQRKYREAMLAAEGGKRAKAEPAAEAMARRHAEAYPPPTPESVSNIASQVLSSDKPDFQSFMDAVRTRHGNIQSGQVSEAFADATWKFLQNATGEQLKSMVEKLGLMRQVFGQVRSKGMTMQLKGEIAGPGPAETGGIELARQKAYDRAARLAKRAGDMRIQLDKTADQHLLAKVTQLKSQLREARDPTEQSALKEQITKAQKDADMSGDAMLRQKLQQVENRAQAQIDAANSGEGLPTQQTDLFGGAEMIKPADFRDPVRGSQMKNRDKAIAAIGKHLLQDRPSMRSGLTRKEIGAEDIRWNEDGTDIYRVTEPDMLDLFQLGQELTAGAATDASTKRLAGGGRFVVKEQALPRSATKRVVAMLDRKTGEVYLVSAYRDGRRGPVFKDPHSVTGEHRTLDEMVKRFRPLYSLPLDMPVQNFVQKFSGMKQFSDKFYGNVQKLARQVGFRGMESEPAIEGTPGLEGQGGFVIGPSADLVRVETDLVEGARDRGVELTEPEARAAYNAMRNIEHSDDVGLMVDGIKQRLANAAENRSRGVHETLNSLDSEIRELGAEMAEEVGANREKMVARMDKLKAKREVVRASIKEEMRPKDWLFISAVTKVADKIHEENKGQTDMTEGQMAEMAIQELYDLSQKTKHAEAYARSAAQRFTKGPRVSPETWQAESERVSPYSKELTMPIERRAPTDIREKNVPAGAPEVRTGAEAGRAAGLPVELETPPEGQQRRLYEERARAMRVKANAPIKRAYEPANIAETPGPRERIEPSPARKAQIQRDINDVAERLSRKSENPPTQAAPTPAPTRPVEVPKRIKEGIAYNSDPAIKEWIERTLAKQKAVEGGATPEQPGLPGTEEAPPASLRRMSERKEFWEEGWKDVGDVMQRAIENAAAAIKKELNPDNIYAVRSSLNGLNGTLNTFIRDSGLQLENGVPIWETVRSDRMNQAAHFLDLLEQVENLQAKMPDAAQTDMGIGSLRRNSGASLGEKSKQVLTDFGSIYDAWMNDRIREYGGRVAKRAATTFNQIIDRQKELYGQLTPLLDRARRLSGGIETSRGPSLAGPLTEVPGKLVEHAKDIPRRTVESVNAMRAVKWMNGLTRITGRTAVAKAVDAIEGNIPIPAYARELVNASQAANMEVGRMMQPTSPGFVASGKWQRNLTGLGYDIIRQGGGKMWDDWTRGVFEANRYMGKSLFGVREDFKAMKALLDDPMTSGAELEKVNQDMARQYPHVVTHVKNSYGGWEEVIHANLFNYLEQSAQRATHVRAFREKFPNTPDGREDLRKLITAVKADLPGEAVADLDALMRAMNGHPTDTPDSRWLDYTRMNPQQLGGQAMRFANQTVNNVLSKAVLSGQMFVQPGEVAAGSTPVFLGYKNYLKGLARVREIYTELERTGAVNRVMHDYTFNPHSPVRSAFKITGNVISKATAQAMLNELQEAAAASTARVVTENILTGRLSNFEKRQLPNTFKIMGFTPVEARRMMAGDAELLGQFQRKAAAFLTGGNKAIAEGSRMGSDRMFNSIFRFQTYPMIKTNQARRVLTNFTESWRTGQNRAAATEQAARFFFGNAMQGAMTVGLTALAYGGLSGLKIRGNEASDEPVKFLSESFLSSMSGPLYLLWRGAKDKGLKGVGEQAARAAFPYAMMNELNDMAHSDGKYKDADLTERIGMFLKSKTPGAQAIGTGLAMFGLANKSQPLDEAIKALGRWRRDKLGWRDEDSYLNEDTQAEFRSNMRKAINAMKEGDADKYMSAWMAAVEAKSENPSNPDKPQSPVEAIQSSLAARKLLRGPAGPLTEEQKLALQKHIGMDAYNRLEDFDMMLDAASRGAVPVY